MEKYMMRQRQLNWMAWMIVVLEIFDGSLAMMTAATAEVNGIEDSSYGKIL